MAECLLALEREDYDTMFERSMEALAKLEQITPDADTLAEEAAGTLAEAGELILEAHAALDRATDLLDAYLRPAGTLLRQRGG